MEWNKLIVGQLEFYWDAHLRPRLDGLTDAEYFWEPVPDAWNLRRIDGRWRSDWAWPEPDPVPVTTIAWRMTHLSVHGLQNRAGTFFGPDRFGGVEMNDQVRWADEAVPGTADEAVAYLEQAYRRWLDGISTLDDAAMAAKLGPKGGAYADGTMAELVLHINREVMHHGGEIALLRDLYKRLG
jgi:hypothetical protein